MAKKKIKLGFKIVQDGRTSCGFALLYFIFVLIDYLILKGKMSAGILASPTAAGGEMPFNPANFISYVKILFYIFGSPDNGVIFLVTCNLIVLFGPALEERYGSIIIAVMMGVSAIFSGVLTACFCQHSIYGPMSIIYMMMFLNAFFNLSKKKIPLSLIFEAGFIIALDLVMFKNPNGIVGVIIGIAGGLCGSLFAFLASPKARAEKKGTKGTGTKGSEGTDLSEKERTAFLEELDSQSPRNKKNNRRNDDDDDTTVVGTLTF